MFAIIVNPNAGRGAATKHAQSLETGLLSENVEFTTVFTTGVMDGYYKTLEFCKNGNIQGIIGVGGDGTMQEITAALFDYFPKQKIPFPLCIYPAGSGNDFVLSLRPKKTNNNFIKKLLNREVKTVDIITAQKTAFLNIGNMGLDAWIVKNAMEYKDRFGSKAYLAAVYKSILSYKPIRLRIETADKTVEGPFTLVAVSNGQYYGGGLQISPMAKTDDGKITLCVVSEMSKLWTMLIFPTLMMKKHAHLKAVEFLECTEVRITPLDEGGVLCLDGNLYPASTELEFKIHESVLDVIV